MKKLIQDDGFTLVELMVVVAIIGILSAVAIPNFKKYQAKSKTSEAKLQLAAIYSAETALMGDWDSYGSCLPAAGYVQSARGYYVVGFSAAATAENLNIRTNAGNNAVCPTDTSVTSGAHQIAPTTTIRVNNTVAVVANLNSAIVAAGGATFTAQARGHISPDKASGTANHDVWNINQNKTLVPVQIGY